MLGVAVSNAKPLHINLSANRMMACLLFLAIILVALFTLGQEGVQAQHTRPRRVTGILTDRLSPNDLRRWSVIERFVLAKDSSEQLLYPTLYDLWNCVES